mmetsp:Transcript_103108/g.183209  ORF Transcript_103108/g.183209 Transcript_103108/m.183209 type:complete len:94 (-) Transcript_103108:651-932(-)
MLQRSYSIENAKPLNVTFASATPHEFKTLINPACASAGSFRHLTNICFSKGTKKVVPDPKGFANVFGFACIVGELVVVIVMSDVGSKRQAFQG